MNSTEQAPDSCPFCGAGILVNRDGELIEFKCGNAWQKRWPEFRGQQSRQCRTAERERLTRELAELKATIKRLEAEKAFLSESHLAQKNKRLVAEMLELRNAIQRDTDAFIRLTRERDEARAERDDSRNAFKRANEAYAKAVSASLDTLETIQALLARVKRLEEAGDEVVEEDDIYNRRTIWRKATAEEAKEAKP